MYDNTERTNPVIRKQIHLTTNRDGSKTLTHLKFSTYWRGQVKNDKEALNMASGSNNKISKNKAENLRSSQMVMNKVLTVL